MTNNVDELLAWMAIGLAGSIAAWIWPFRRGVAGIVISAAIAIAGAVSLGLLERLIRSYTHLVAATSLLFAAVGAIGALLLVHIVWAMFAVYPRRGPPRRGQA